MAYLRLTNEKRSKGFIRSEVRDDVLYGYCKIREVAVSVARGNATVTRIDDGMASQMLDCGLIDRNQYNEYLSALAKDIYNVDRFDSMPIESVYAYIARFRRRVLGQAVDKHLLKLANTDFDFVPDGIDQSKKKAELLASKGAVIFAITQAELFGQMLADVSSASGKDIWVLCDGALTELLPENVRILTLGEGGVSADDLLSEYVEKGDACLFVYGEEGLIACRGLTVDAVVHAYPKGYHGQAVTGLWSGEGCIVYVPRGYDMTVNVPLTQKTRLNFKILYELWKEFGDGVYDLSVNELYGRYPEYFINIYSGKKSGFPVSVNAGCLSEFDEKLDVSLKNYLGSYENAEYYSAYFDKSLTRQPICYDSEKNQDGILVQAVKIKKSEGARVISCEKGKTPRQTFEGLKLSGTGLVSNFLFFMTPKLGVLYNDLRADRPLEQADAASGHLDYMRAGGCETFPLFAKACIAMKADGRFLFFNHRLGGGRIRISGISYRWEAENVNSDVSDIRIYAPSYSASDSDADRNTYKKLVGEGRVNVVILSDKITCIRRGGVLLPSVGVVLSLTEDAACSLLEKCVPLSDGYYNVTGLTLDVKLDPPTGVSAEEWSGVKWAYGGGLTLIRDGIGLCDGDNMEKWFAEEGWTNPLSRQTQESNLHSLVKHPRTAIGCTADGSLIILVYSGRTRRSTGADYSEMITIARELFPDAYYLMNCDGGGSAMLGTVRDGEFLELSFPSTSSGSCAGQVRPINTVFYVPIE